MAKPLTSHRPGLAIALKVGAIGVFTVMAALVKATSDEVPPGEAVFFRSAFAIPVILIWLVLRRELASGLIAKNPWMHVRRGLLGTTAMGLTFFGLGSLPLPEVTAIGYAAPIFTLILAALILGERIRFIRISAVAMGLAGVLVMLWPRLGGNLGDGATIGAIAILVATLMRALVQIQVRQMVQSETASSVVFYFSITASLLALCTLPFGWVVPSLSTALLLVLAGLLGGVAQILITSSFRFAQASMLAPYDYVSMLFALIIGYAYFDEWPTLVMLSGALLVILGNVLVIWRERQLGVSRRLTRPETDPKS